MKLIAIDCGASFLKGAVMDENGKILSQEKYAADSFAADTAIGRILCGVKLLLERLSEGLTQFGLAVSNEMHGFLLTDPEGAPITDYISWQKEWAGIPCGAATYLELFRRRVSPDDILSTGMQAKAGLPSTNLFYLISSKKLRTDRAVRLYTLGDYLLRTLSGREPCIHPTNAAATGLFELKENRWNERLLRGIGADFVLCPPTAESGAVLSFEWMGKQIYAPPAIGDQQASLLGAGLEDDGSLSVNLGTGSQISVACGLPELSSLYQSRPFFKGLYLKTIPHIPAGRALNVYVRFLKEILTGLTGKEPEDGQLWEYILKSAAKIRENEEPDCLKVDLSYFSNAVTDHTLGSIQGINESNLHTGPLFWAAFRQMAENYYVLSQRLLDGAGPKRLVFTGGLSSRIPMLTGLIREQFKDCQEVRVVENDTLLGLWKYFYEQL